MSASPDDDEGSGDAPPVSVVVPCGPAVPGLGALLESLALQDGATPRFEVVLVDNGAGLEPAELGAARFTMRVVAEPTAGSYAARNRGVAASRGGVIAFTDADCRVAPGWIRNGLAALDAAPPVDIVGGRVAVVPRRPARPNAIERHQLVQAFGQEYFVRELRFSVTANLFARRRLFDRGGFLPALFSGGDAEWCQRQVAAGATIRFAENAVVFHPARRSWGGLARQRRRTVGGRWMRAKSVGHPPVPLDDIRSTYERPFARTRYFGGHPLLASPFSRLGFLAVELFLFAVTRFERARLALGGRTISK